VATGRGRSRRVSLPGVSELLRPAAVGPDGGDQRQASGREKHTQKITVYLSAEELLDLERARLALLRYGASADRGRIVREAIAVLLADLDARGQESLLARRVARSIAADAISGEGTGEGTAAALDSTPDDTAPSRTASSRTAPGASVPRPSPPGGNARRETALSAR
jgi:hypothetical protein